MKRVRVLPGQLGFDFWGGRVRRRPHMDRPTPEIETTTREQIIEDERACAQMHRWRGRPAIGRVG